MAGGAGEVAVEAALADVEGGAVKPCGVRELALADAGPAAEQTGELAGPEGLGVGEALAVERLVVGARADAGAGAKLGGGLELLRVVGHGSLRGSLYLLWRGDAA